MEMKNKEENDGNKKKYQKISAIHRIDILF